MKKLYLILLMLLILFIPATNAVAVYQLDQPVSELNGHTLREVFQNRNMAMPDLSSSPYLGGGLYSLYNVNGITLDYNPNSGIYLLNGTLSGELVLLLFNFLPYQQYTNAYIYVSGSFTGNNQSINYRSPSINEKNITTIGYTVNQSNTMTVTTQEEYVLYMRNGSIYNNWQFKLQLEIGSQVSPYQVPTNGPYSDIDLGQFGLTSNQIQKYYDLYLEAVRFEEDNKEAVKDPGQYKHIFMSIYEGLTNLMRSMGSVWRFLTTPFVDTTLSDMDNLFSIDWSWDIFDVLRQWITNMAVWILQLNAVLIGTLFLILGIPLKVSILSLVFSDLVFVILGWIMIKSFII